MIMTSILFATKKEEEEQEKQSFRSSLHILILNEYIKVDDMRITFLINILNL